MTLLAVKAYHKKCMDSKVDKFLLLINGNSVHVPSDWLKQHQVE